MKKADANLKLTEVKFNRAIKETSDKFQKRNKDQNEKLARCRKEIKDIQNFSTKI